MDAPTPFASPFQEKPNSQKINYLEEIIVKKDKKEFNLQFGINELNIQEIYIKLEEKNSNNLFSFQNKFSQKNFQDFSKIFCLYKDSKEIISFLKTLKYEIIEKSDNIIIKFNVFLPNGENEFIELKLNQTLIDSNNLMINLLNENKLLKEEINNNKKEINNNKKEILKFESQINLLKEENKKLWDKINKLEQLLNNSNKVNLNPLTNIGIDSKIFKSINDLDFILNYIKLNDKNFGFSSLKLLFRGSRDGDSLQKCHELCDNKKNVLEVIKSDSGYIFGGYCKIGFKINKNCEYKIDNDSFIFSFNLKKIYPAVKNSKGICYIGPSYGLCFCNSLAFYDKFMNNKNSYVCRGGCGNYFSGLSPNHEINGGSEYFKCEDLEVFQLV
jgi:hypothetical protein